MSKLAALRSRLEDLRRRRHAVRLGTAYAALALAVLWTLLALFALDWTFEFARLQRLVLIVAAAVVVIWAARKFTLPWLGQKESELDVALLVERQQNIDSDLVAAIQFESPDAARWGSPQLEHAVIDYVGEFGQGWNILEGFSKQLLVRRAAALTATIVLLGLLIAMAPLHARAFLNRLLLGSAHYPTRTHIDSLNINGRVVELDSADERPMANPYGRPLRFELQASGELPPAGRVELKNAGGGEGVSIELARKDSSAVPAVYSGQLPKLVDSLTYQLYLGDAWTDPATIRLIELPVVDTKLSATAPSYARGAEVAAEPTALSRQISVLEGSQVSLTVSCGNKALREATLVVDGKKFPLERDERAKAIAGRAWKLPAGSPLDRVEKQTKFQIMVVDEDALELEQPLEGMIRIRSDQRPRIGADVVTRFVLPSATPKIEYRAVDDFGIARLLARVVIQRADGTTSEREPVEIRQLKQPILRDELPQGGAGSYQFNLTPLNVVKGDQVKLTLEVVDYRGTAPGQSASSEPIVLQVTDEAGILASISESDERSARQLDAIIQRQLGIGDQK